MNSSAERADRKWPNGAPGRGPAAMVTAAALLLALLSAGTAEARHARFDPFADFFSGGHRARHNRAARHAARERDHAAPDHPEPAPAETVPAPVPLPRPAEAPQDAPQKQEANKAAPAQQPPAAELWEPKQEAAKPPPAGSGKPAEGPSASSPAKPTEAAAPAAPPSACRLALTEDIAIAPSVPSIHGPGDCGGDDLVRLEAIVLPDKHKVKLTPAATLRCHMASEVAEWVRADVAPIAREFGQLSTLDNYDSYECRNFNGKAGAHLSEHGHANALDVHGFGLEGGREMVLTDRSVPREVREKLLWSVCRRFMTVLGPDSDGYHEDHIHIDLMERRNDYKICEWDVLDPMPEIAPLLPAERPPEAPPRQVAAALEAAKPGSEKAAATGKSEPPSQGGASEPAEQKAAPAKPAVSPESDKPGKPARKTSKTAFKTTSNTDLKSSSKAALRSPHRTGPSGDRRATKKRR